MRIAIVAGEISGDNLGAGLVKALKTKYPDAIIEGIAGKNMQKTGCNSLYPIETLSVMGFIPVLKKLPQILKMRRQLLKHFANNPPDIFIGIDAPDFNLTIAEKLKKKGIKTIQYVCPSVWAWKAWRMKKIKRATDLVLCLFPFEVEFYQRQNHPALFVGHPLASKLPLIIDQNKYRTRLNLDPNKTYLAILPGSRAQEVKILLPLFLQAAKICQQKISKLECLLPLASTRLQTLVDENHNLIDKLPLQCFDGDAESVMAASNVVLLASGTAALEAMLLKKPMVVAYKISALGYFIAKLLVKIPYLSLPNILAKKALVPELIQNDVTPQALADAIMQQLKSPTTVETYTSFHKMLKQNADQKSAQAVIDLLEGKKSC